MIQPQPLNLTPPTTVKRYVQDPDLSTLNEGQNEAMQIFQDFDKDLKAKYFILEGWAGTGKTYLGSIMIEWLLWNSMSSIQVAMTAPVNDAVKVLKASATFYDERLNYGTLHSLAGLKAQLDKKTGELKFKKDWHKPCILDSCDYLVIDEGSMLSDELFNIIHTNYVATGKLKVIIIGDGGQIPPVGQSYAIPFSQKGREEYDMWFYELSTIVRQSEGSPIINFTAGLRRNLSKPNPIVLKKSSVTDNKGLLFLDSSRQKEYIQLIKDLFQSEHFQKNPNYCKIICWRNKYVDTFNKLVRGFIFGKGIDKIVIGEKMVASDAVMSGYDTIVMTNGTKFEVLELDVKTCKPFETTKYQYYDAKVQTTGLRRRICTSN